MRPRERFHAKDTIKQLNPTATLSFRDRGMGIWDATELVSLGFFHRATETFIWCEVGAATMGTKVPTHIGDTPDEPNIEEHEEATADDDMERHEEPTAEQQQPPPPTGGTVRQLDDQENNAAAAANVKKQRVL